VDEAFGDFIPEYDSAIHLIDKVRSLCVVRSFSKAYDLPDIRSGYVFMSAQLATIYGELDVPYEPALPSILISCEMLADSSALLETRRRIREFKLYLISGMRTFGLQFLPTHPYVPIMMAQIATGSLYDYFFNLGIDTVPGSAFANTLAHLDDRSVRIKVPATRHAVNDLLARMERCPPCA